MSTLILPVAGKSSRFPNMRPKWLLTMPDGKFMIEKSIENIDLSVFENVIIVALKEHIDLYLSENAVSQLCKNIGIKNVLHCFLDKPTSSQSETVAFALRKFNITSSFFIKDCDNSFEFSWNGTNQVASLDLNNTGLVDAKNKSYIEVDPLGNITNIVEKHVISNFFCCGGYGFDSGSNFLKHFEQHEIKTECYISHIIYSMLMAGDTFKIGYADKYNDWGTLREYRHFTRSHITIFCDVDGVLFENGSKFGKKGWNTSPISENLEILSRLQKKKLLYLIVTSCRPDSQIDFLRDELSKYDIVPDRYLMGLPHTRRLLINDFSNTNPYPSAMSINLKRNSKDLSALLESICS
jgi:hypothetical protein